MEMSKHNVRDFAESARMGSGAVDGDTVEAINQLTMGAAPEHRPDRLIEITNDIQWGKTRQQVALGILAGSAAQRSR